MEPLIRAFQPQDPPLVLCLERREHTSASIQAKLVATLTTGELERLNGYRRQADRERFLLGRGCLRQWLGCWQNLAPDAVKLDLTPLGKPHAPGGPEFNLSHSGDLILIALHPCQPVGVDVERLRPDLHWEPVARRMLAPDQVRELLQLPAAEQPLAFLQHWCQLEATAKATGQGIARTTRGHQGKPLQQGHQSTQSPQAREPQTVDGPTRGCRHWSLDLPDRYRGCAAILAPHFRRANLISAPDQRA